MKLKVYSKHQSQNDNNFSLKNYRNSTAKFLDIAGVESTAKYFQIVYCLRCEVAKQLKLTKVYFYSKPLISLLV